MDILNDCEEKMKSAVDRLQDELSTIRAGRANPAILDKVSVLYYGVPTPLKQVANVVVPEARMLEVKPWDKSSLKDIEKAIIDANLNLTPNNDGNVIRLQFPELTEDRRKELVKDVKKVVEDFKVNVRNCRRDAMDEVKKQEKDKLITEDDVKAYEKDIQDVTDKYISLIDKVCDTFNITDKDISINGINLWEPKYRETICQLIEDHSKPTHILEYVDPDEMVLKFSVNMFVTDVPSNN